jgi:hypothetical protein
MDGAGFTPAVAKASRTTALTLVSRVSAAARTAASSGSGRLIVMGIRR